MAPTPRTAKSVLYKYEKIPLNKEIAREKINALPWNSRHQKKLVWKKVKLPSNSAQAEFRKVHYVKRALFRKENTTYTRKLI